MTRWRKAARAAVVLGLVAVAGAARASGDSSCHPAWRPVLFSQDCANTAVIGPANDTRVNLLLLRLPAGAPAGPYPKFEWEDRAMGRSFFTWQQLRAVYGSAAGGAEREAGSGSRCDSLASGAAGFQAALAAEKGLAATERESLDAARKGLAGGCNGNARPLQSDWPSFKSAAAKAFLGYLQAADAFYAGQWDAARQGFSAVAKARQPWVSETAAYMAIRVELNAAQADAFDEYGGFNGPDKVDQAAVARGKAAIAAYLKRWPKGRYAASAAGLERRVQWLGGDIAGLSKSYDRLLSAAPAAGTSAADVIQEIDNKLLFSKGAESAIASPLLLATHDLMRMREYTANDLPRLTAAELSAQAPRFAARPDLYAYLLAAQAFYVERDPGRTLSLLNVRAKAPAADFLGFSRAALRGLALAGKKDPTEAAQWQALLPSAKAPYQRELVELALAIAWEQAGRIDDIFAANSPIRDGTIREILLRKVAGPELLRRVVRDAGVDRHQHDVALFSLLDGDLSHARLADFGRDRPLIPAGADTKGYLGAFPLDEQVPIGLFASGTWSDGYPCGSLAETAAKLAANAADTPARLCLGDFWRLNGFDRLGGDDYVDPAAKDGGPLLGSSGSRFPGALITRASLYAGILANAKTAPDDRAYALYRSVMCYAPSGSNDCGGADVPKAQRKAWFETLKREFPDSRWARDLRYYW